MLKKDKMEWFVVAIIAAIIVFLSLFVVRVIDFVSQFNTLMRQL